MWYEMTKIGENCKYEKDIETTLNIFWNNMVSKHK